MLLSEGYPPRGIWKTEKELSNLRNSSGNRNLGTDSSPGAVYLMALTNVTKYVSIKKVLFLSFSPIWDIASTLSYLLIHKSMNILGPTHIAFCV